MKLYVKIKIKIDEFRANYKNANTMLETFVGSNATGGIRL